MNIEAAGAIWTPMNSSEQSANDAYRITTSINDETVIALAIGFLSLPGMSSVGFNEASHLVMAYVPNYLSRSSTDPPKRIKEAIILAEKEMATLNQDPDDFAVGHSCTLICALLKDYQAFIGWIGSNQAYLIRGGNIIAQTAGHLMSKENPDMWQAFFNKWKYNPSRAIGSNGINEIQSQSELLIEPWSLEPNDSIIFATNMLLEIIEVEDLSKIIWGNTPKESAEKLVERARAQDREKQWGVGAVVVGVD